MKEMKNSISQRLTDAAEKARALGKVAVKHPISSALSLCMLIGVTATLITLSQTTEPVEQAAAAPMALPAENVELVDNRGRAITATVLRTDTAGITIKMEDGREAQIAWNKLSAETVEKITGKKAEIRIPKKLPQRIPTAIRVQLLDAGRPAQKELNKLSVQEVHKLFLKNDDLVNTATAGFKAQYEDEAAVGLHKDPEWLKYNLSPFDLIPKLEMPKLGEEEKFSLRPELEKLGVRALKQQGNTCTQYASYHLTQYLTLKDGGKPPTFKQMLTGFELVGGRERQAPDKVQAHKLGEVLGKVYGKRAYNMPIFCGNYKLSVEIAKYHLRKGRPILATVWQNGSHLTLIVGFHTDKKGNTTFEILDSNRLEIDKGYGKISKFSPSTGTNCIWFE